MEKYQGELLSKNSQEKGFDIDQNLNQGLSKKNINN